MAFRVWETIVRFAIRYMIITSTTHRFNYRLIEGLYVGLLVLYVFAGMTLTPFHGDEATTIYSSRDWFTIVTIGNFSSLMYRPLTISSPDYGDQELRLLNGPVSRYLIGLTDWSLGLTVKDLGRGWNWDRDWWQNRYYGSLPNPGLLLVSRLPSTWMTMLSVAIVFAIARRVGCLLSNGRFSGRGTARLAAFIYATLPAVLVNGRRAIFEGGTLLSIALLIWLGLEILQLLQRRGGLNKTLRRRWLLLGVVTGFAAATKHTTLLTAAAIFGGLVLVSLMERRVLTTITGLVVAGIIAGGVFVALNPAWWSMPLQMPGIVLPKRTNMINGQVHSFIGFTGLSARLWALVAFPFGPPQYYENPNQPWDQWLGDQIPPYAVSGLAGIDWLSLSPIIGLLLLGALPVLWAARRPPLRSAMLLLLSVTLFTLLTIFILNPLPWQRYYLPLAAPLALLCGLGGMFWVQGGLMLWQRSDRVSVNLSEQPNVQFSNDGRGH